MSDFEKIVNLACKQYGASQVRKAAIKQMKGNDKALDSVDLGAYVFEYNDLLRISHLAFDAMSPQDQMREHLYKSNFSEEEVEKFIAGIDFEKLKLLYSER